jgi:hypothetical protein
MWRWILNLVTRKRTARDPGPSLGQQWNTADQAAAAERLRDQARRRQAEHLYDWRDR